MKNPLLLSVCRGFPGALLAAALFSAPISSFAEEISYSIYSLPMFGDQVKLVAEGRRSYAHADIKITPGPAQGGANWEKTLALEKEFQIGVSVYLEPQVDGFGMWIRKDGEGFSWEWFSRDSADTFRKLQGPGRLKARFKRTAAGEEIAELEFLSDVTMRLNTRWYMPFMRKDTDRIVIRAGSILWLAQ